MAARRVLARGRGCRPAQSHQAIALGEHKQTARTRIIADDDSAVRSVLTLAIVRCGLEPQGLGTAREMLDACRRDAPISCSSTSRSWKSILRATLTGPSPRARRRLPPIRRRDLGMTPRY
jgi:hypothetical protein